MKARIYKPRKQPSEKFIEFVAENKEETEILRALFNGEGPRRYKVSSFGYDRKMPRKAKGQELQEWAEKQVLTFKLEP
jgi:hypothetical protein